MANTFQKPVRSLVIAVTTEKGGVSKSTASIILASGFAQGGLDTILVDTDGKNKTCLHWSATCEDEITPTVVGITHPDSLRKDIPKLRGKYDVIVIDGAAQADKMLSSAVAQSDLVVIPTKPSPPDIWTLADGIIDKVNSVQVMRENAGATPAKIFFLVSQQKTGTSLAAGVAEAVAPFGFPILDTRLTHLIGYSESLIGTNPLNALSPKVQGESRAFLEEIAAELGLLERTGSIEAVA